MKSGASYFRGFWRPALAVCCWRPRSRTRGSGGCPDAVRQSNELLVARGGAVIGRVSSLGIAGATAVVGTFRCFAGKVDGIGQSCGAALEGGVTRGRYPLRRAGVGATALGIRVARGEAQRRRCLRVARRVEEHVDRGRATQPAGASEVRVRGPAEQAA